MGASAAAHVLLRIGLLVESRIFFFSDRISQPKSHGTLPFQVRSVHAACTSAAMKFGIGRMRRTVRLPGERPDPLPRLCHVDVRHTICAPQPHQSKHNRVALLSVRTSAHVQHLQSYLYLPGLA